MIVVAVIFFWNDIVNVVLVEIPKFFLETISNFFKDMWKGIKKNWLTIGLTIFAYKFTLLVVSNLSKRFIINRSVDRFKKSLIFSEMDELLAIYFRIKIENFNKLVDRWEKIPFIGWFIGIVVRFLSWILFLIVLFIFIIKTGLYKVIFTKVLSAQFWTNILLFVMNIPGFFVITGLIIWLWLEAHIPWIPKFYYWVSMKFRILLDPIWDSLVIPFSKWVVEKLLIIEQNIFKPISDWFDKLELRIIHRLKEFIYYEKGEEVYEKYMELVKKHNEEQLYKKEEKAREIRIKKISAMRKRVQTLRELKKKKEAKIKKN